MVKKMIEVSQAEWDKLNKDRDWWEAYCSAESDAGWLLQQVANNCLQLLALERHYSKDSAWMPAAELAAASEQLGVARERLEAVMKKIRNSGPTGLVYSTTDEATGAETLMRNTPEHAKHRAEKMKINRLGEEAAKKEKPARKAVLPKPAAT